LSGKNLTPDWLTHPTIVVGIIILMITISVLAGSYPAFYLTSFRPVEVLKGKIRAGMKSSGIRNALVVFQFMISIALIISTLMVNRQINFLQNKNLGFNKEHILDLLHTGNLGKNGEAFKNELLSYPEIAGASFSNRLPPNIDWTSSFQSEAGDKTYLLAIYTMDHDHLKTMGYEMAKGRFFSRDFPADSSAVILNETAALQMGMTDFQGKKIKTFFDTESGRNLEVIGILKDFNFETLKSSIRPMAILLGRSPNWEMAVRLSPGNTQEKVKLIEKIWKKYAPNTPFEYSFIDQNFDAQFRAEQRLSQVILVFTTLAIVIACLGLFGLATFTAEQRSKEISIRKVMGASVPQVIILLSKDFARLVLFAFVIAIPITWYGMSQWLQGFAYRIDFSFYVVGISGVLALAVALFTISFQSAKAALNNPVNALRSE
jgi:putative ABC transport system permease protein